MGSFFVWEGNPKGRASAFDREPQGDADIAIHESEGVVISNDHDWASQVPAIARREESFLMEAFCDQGVERIDPKGPLSYSCENLEGAMCFKYFESPGRKIFGVCIP